MRRLGVAALVVLLASVACGRPRVPHLEHRQWRLVELDGQQVRRTADERSPHLMFHKDGRVSGLGGCNRIAGTFEADGDRMTFGPLAATRMACAEGMDIETAFLGALERVRRWTIERGRLGLHGDAGSPLAVFEEQGPPR